MAIDTSDTVGRSPDDQKQPAIGKGWVQGVALVMICGFFIMGFLAYRTYTASMPMPDKVVDESGQVLFTGAEVTRGQELFQARGLMQYGSVHGHGAYLGPDYTADYLRRAADDVTAELERAGEPEVRERVVTEFRTNRFDEDTRTLVFTDRQAAAFERLQQHYGAHFGADARQNGLLPNLITDPAEIHDLTAFFAWSAWAAAAERPGHNYTYTNNWPAEPRVDNGPSADLIVWSALVTGGAARRDGHPVRRIRPVEPDDRLARRQYTSDLLPAARRGETDPLATGHGVVLRDRHRALLGPGATGRARRALPRRPVVVLRDRPGAVVAVQPGQNLACATGAVLDGRRVFGRRYLS